MFLADTGMILLFICSFANRDSFNIYTSWLYKKLLNTMKYGESQEKKQEFDEVLGGRRGSTHPLRCLQGNHAARTHGRFGGVRAARHGFDVELQVSLQQMVHFSIIVVVVPADVPNATFSNERAREQSTRKDCVPGASCGPGSFLIHPSELKKMILIVSKSIIISEFNKEPNTVRLQGQTLFCYVMFPTYPMIHFTSYVTF